MLELKIVIRLAEVDDAPLILRYDHHIAAAVLDCGIKQGLVYVACDGERFAGWLRYNLFWDNTPFMNMLYLLPDYRGKGLGRRFVAKWEEDMKSRSFNYLMTSTQQNEYAQHFYLKLGYKAVGGFMQPDGEYEILLAKII